MTLRRRQPQQQLIAAEAAADALCHKRTQT